MNQQNRFQWPVRPKADAANQVIGKNYRFTVLTDCLLRMEYDPQGTFEDRASQSVFYRDFPEVSYTAECKDGVLNIETEALVLTYQEGTEFSAGTLSVHCKKEPAGTWNFSEDFEDLGGTTKTLDMVNGSCPLERGVCSRGGFSVLDDSHSLVLGEDGWVEVRHPDTIDCYFFGYGYNYLGAVQDYYRLMGVPSMLPAYALGNWWSRYHKYTQQEYIDLMERFKKEDIPFSVSVIDMDWHVTQIPEEQKDEDKRFQDGWTGYSWNKDLFPDYKAFLKYLHDNHLATSLNLHPHAGVCKHEDMYEEMAKARGIDPASGKRVPLDILSQDAMADYFDILHHPYEEDGVDFWWMDWQQGTDYWWIHEPNTPGHMLDEREVLDPLWMLNHLHILDIMRNGKRPMFFSRYSGPGSQRYPVGFSGDSFTTWESLEFQPYFTATASNIGYGWWSHDIGGHQRGYKDDELIVRWLQLGVFSPINRLHSMDDNFARKEPWNYGEEAYPVLSDWLRLRHALFPYLYTMNYRTHTELLPLIQPMYYKYPKCEGAYQVPNQYWFGSELMVAPITEKRDEVSCLAKATVWLPRGDWFDFFGGARYASKRGRKMNVYRKLSQYPVFAKAGAIVPMAVRTPHDNRLVNAAEMEVYVFPGAENQFALYEDEGDYNRFEQGVYAITNMKLHWSATPTFTIHPAEGDLSLIPEKRIWHLKLRGFHKDVQVTVYKDGQKLEAEVTRDASTNTTEVTVEAFVTEKLEVQIKGDVLIHDNQDRLARSEEILQKSQIDLDRKDNIMRWISDEKASLHTKIYQITGFSAQSQPVVEAIKEQFTLTEDPYTGSELE